METLPSELIHFLLLERSPVCLAFTCCLLSGSTLQKWKHWKFTQKQQLLWWWWEKCFAVFLLSAAIFTKRLYWCLSYPQVKMICWNQFPSASEAMFNVSLHKLNHVLSCVAQISTLPRKHYTFLMHSPSTDLFQVPLRKRSRCLSSKLTSRLNVTLRHGSTNTVSLPCDPNTRRLRVIPPAACKMSRCPLILHA